MNNRSINIVLAITGLLAAFYLLPSLLSRIPRAGNSPMTPSYFGDEYDLYRKLEQAKTDAERTAIIDKIDDLPIDGIPFYHRWLLVQNVSPFEYWTDSEYDPALSDVPHDIQLLAAMSYGKSDIENGGFHQFFSNSTGVFAPEMIEWCERAGLHETAEVIREAVAFFGDKFPRSREVRNRVLQEYPNRRESDDRDTIPIGQQVWDPFYSLSSRFYASLPYEEKVFDKAADRWLRDVCGITSLHDPIPPKTNEP